MIRRLYDKLKSSGTFTKPKPERSGGGRGGPSKDLIREQTAARRRAQTAAMHEQLLREHLDGTPVPPLAEAEPRLFRNLPVPVKKSAGGLPAALTSRPPREVLDLVDGSFAAAQSIVPFELDEDAGVVRVATALKPTGERALAIERALAQRAGRALRVEYVDGCGLDELRRLIARFYPRATDELVALSHSAARELGDAPRAAALAASDTDSSIRQFVLGLIELVAREDLGDIKFIAARTGVRVRVGRRIPMRDPIGRELPPHAAALIARVVKQLCEPHLDLLDTRSIQKGRLVREVSGPYGPVQISCRVTTMPTPLGAETITLRVHNQSARSYRFGDIVRDEFTRAQLLSVIAGGRGLVLIVAPPSQGKSTLAHSVLTEEFVDGSTTVSIEDPIEIANDHIQQYHFDPTGQAGPTAIERLRGLLQSTVFKVFVGECKEQELARDIFEACEGGVQVLTTLHAHSAVEGFQRLAGLGISHVKLAQQIQIVIGTRLIDAVCPACAEPETVSREDLLRAGLYEQELGAVRLRRGRGTDCELCDETGRHGYVSVWETIPMTDALADVLRRASDQERDNLVAIQAVRAGMTPMWFAILEEVCRGRIPFSALAAEKMPPAHIVGLWREMRGQPPQPSSLRLIEKAATGGEL